MNKEIKSDLATADNSEFAQFKKDLERLLLIITEFQKSERNRQEPAMGKKEFSNHF